MEKLENVHIKKGGLSASRSYTMLYDQYKDKDSTLNIETYPETRKRPSKRRKTFHDGNEDETSSAKASLISAVYQLLGVQNADDLDGLDLIVAYVISFPVADARSYNCTAKAIVGYRKSLNARYGTSLASSHAQGPGP